MASFNILHGFPEALVRGMRSSFLSDADYHHLTQCETLDDVKLNLSETDYGDALADMGALIPTGLQKAAVEKVSSADPGRQCFVVFNISSWYLNDVSNGDSIRIVMLSFY